MKRIFLIISMLLSIVLAGCGADEAIRQPDLPVVDIGALDMNDQYFVFRLESDYSVDRPIYVHMVTTRRGHYENDRFRRFEIRTEGNARIIAGLQELSGAVYRTIEPWMAQIEPFSGIELPFQEGERGIVTSAVIEISQPSPDDTWALEKGHPFTVGISTVMFTTHGNIVRR